MKNKNVIIGETYIAKVSGQRVKVRIDSVSPFGGWNATNLKTKHSVRIKTAARLSYASLPKEVSVMTRMSGLAQAARTVVAEQRLFEGPLATDKVQ